MSRDDAYVLDMIRFAREVIELSSGVTRDEYVSNLGKRRSIERSLELIGEAARRVSSPFREDHPEIPWRDIIGQRSVLAHDYGDVNDERVWETARERVPDLLGALERLVKPEGQLRVEE
ncbi:MAG TPA: HepT-like ribonuclease domain-containing protein [Thermoanaerobaculia bacterium]|jgi:uncharacterized protein with HEPN domain|nr:HepT-like ribonuclease domain-containing protein [Thermoanaerobaculia bacterium]